MPRRRAPGLVAMGALGVMALTGCSVDTIIWGPEGAQVIALTEQLVEEIGETGRSDLVCPDADPRLGDPGAWTGRAAGEPERFVADYWREQAVLEPDWSINLEFAPPGAEPGDEFPSDVFYRADDGGLCVVDVAWSTLVTVG